VSPATVEAGQFLAHIDDPQVHKTAARLGTEFLGRVHERRSDSSLLVAWIHRQQAEVSAFALEFNIDTAQECVTVLGQPFGEQKLSRFHQRLHRIDRDPVTIHQERFDRLERSVDQSSDSIRVFGLSKTKPNRVHHS
jgi:hypothetical protein